MSAKSDSANTDSSGVLPSLARLCEEEESWVDIDPPTDEQQRESPNIIGNWEGKPIKTGFLIEDRSEKVEENEKVLTYKVFRTSKYNIHFRVKEVEYPAETEYSHVGHTGPDGTLEVVVPDKSDAEGELNLVAERNGREGAYTTDGDLQPERGELSIDADGEIEAGSTVTITVTDEEGETLAGADVYQQTPVKLATGQVFVREVEGYK